MTSHSNYRLWGKASGSYPIYMINGSLLDGPEQDAVGFFIIDIDDKMVHMKINMTPGKISIVSLKRASSFGQKKTYIEKSSLNSNI